MNEIISGAQLVTIDFITMEKQHFHQFPKMGEKNLNYLRISKMHGQREFRKVCRTQYFV